MSLHTLYVDDDHAFLTIMCEILVEGGFEVTGCRSPEEAQTLLALHHYDVVVTDYHMVSGSGGDLSKYCHSRRIPCIVVSGSFDGALAGRVADSTLVINKLSLLADEGRRLLQHIRDAAVKTSA